MFARSLFVVAAIAAVAVYVPGIANSYLSADRSEGSANGAETATVEPVSTARYTGNRGVTLEALQSYVPTLTDAKLRAIDADLAKVPMAK